MEDRIGSIEKLCDVVTAVANMAVFIGCKRTSSGSYILGYEDFKNLISEGDYMKYFHLIAAEVGSHDEVLDIDVIESSFEMDCNFALEYCQNYEWCYGDEAVFGCSYEEWENSPARAVSKNISLTRMAEIGRTAIENVIELNGRSGESLMIALGLTPEELDSIGIEDGLEGGDEQ